LFHTTLDIVEEWLSRLWQELTLGGSFIKSAVYKDSSIFASTGEVLEALCFTREPVLLQTAVWQYDLNTSQVKKLHHAQCCILQLQRYMYVVALGHTRLACMSYYMQCERSYIDPCS
jgi:hypothetical protein